MTKQIITLSCILGCLVFQVGFYLSGYGYPTHRSPELVAFIGVNILASIMGGLLASLYVLNKK